MALIICPECGREVSSTAAQCPHCGYALKRDMTIKVQFPQTRTLLQGCYVYDDSGNLLARCKQGGVATFETDKEEINIKCTIPGYFGSAKTTAKPGEKFVVNTTLFGGLRISKF